MLLNFLIFCLLGLLVKTLFEINKSNKIDRFLFFSLTIYVLLWYILPITLSFVGWSIYENTIFKFSLKKITIEDYKFYAFLDLLFIVLILNGFLLVVKRITFSGIKFFHSKDLNTDRFKFKFILISFFLLSYFLLRPSASYLERNDLNTQDVSGGMLMFFLDYVSAFLILIIIRYKNKISRLFFLLVNVFYIIYAIKIFMSGARISILGPMLIYSFVIIYNVDRQRRFKYIVLLLGCFFIIGALMPIVSSLRTKGEFGLSDISSSKKNNLLDGFIVEVGLKLNNTFYGTYLCEYGGWNNAGLNPYINSLYSVIPSFVFKNKPAPISKDGDLKSTPTRYAASYISNNDVFNVGVNPSQVALWHLGIVGYFLTIFFLVFYVYLINKLLLSGLFYSQLMGVLLLSYPYIDFLSTLDFVIRDFPRYLIVYFIFLFFEKYKKGKLKFYL